MICSFFGHKDSPESVKPALELAVRQTIERYPDIIFYVGHNGSFDRMVLSALRKLSEDFPLMSYAVILAYLPTDKDKFYSGLPTIYPEGIESVPKRYAISYRNDWIVKQSDIVICYIAHSFGGAAKFVEKARKKGEMIYNLANSNTPIK